MGMQCCRGVWDPGTEGGQSLGELQEDHREQFMLNLTFSAVHRNRNQDTTPLPRAVAERSFPSTQFPILILCFHSKLPQKHFLFSVTPTEFWRNLIFCLGFWSRSQSRWGVVWRGEYSQSDLSLMPADLWCI